MQLEEILNAIEALDNADLVPVLEVVTSKLAWQFGYLDSYSIEEEIVEEPVWEDVPAEVQEEIAEEIVDDRLSL